MEEMAKVIEKNEDKAIVQILRHSACSKCEHNCDLAGESHEIEAMDIEVENTINAGVGNTVALEMGSKTLIFASLTVYLLPLIALIFGYFFGEWLGAKFNYSSVEHAGSMGSFVFLVLAFLILRIVNHRLKIRKEFQPQITKILKS